MLYFILRGVAGDGKPFFFNTWFPLDTGDIVSYILVIFMQVTYEAFLYAVGWISFAK